MLGTRYFYFFFHLVRLQFFRPSGSKAATARPNVVRFVHIAPPPPPLRMQISSHNIYTAPYISLAYQRGE